MTALTPPSAHAIAQLVVQYIGSTGACIIDLPAIGRAMDICGSIQVRFTEQQVVERRDDSICITTTPSTNAGGPPPTVNRPLAQAPPAPLPQGGGAEWWDNGWPPRGPDHGENTPQHGGPGNNHPRPPSRPHDQVQGPPGVQRPQSHPSPPIYLPLPQSDDPKGGKKEEGCDDDSEDHDKPTKPPRPPPSPSSSRTEPPVVVKIPSSSSSPSSSRPPRPRPTSHPQDPPPPPTPKPQPSRNPDPGPLPAPQRPQSSSSVSSRPPLTVSRISTTTIRLTTTTTIPPPPTITAATVVTTQPPPDQTTTTTTTSPPQTTKSLASDDDDDDDEICKSTYTSIDVSHLSDDDNDEHEQHLHMPGIDLTQHHGGGSSRGKKLMHQYRVRCGVEVPRGAFPGFREEVTTEGEGVFAKTRKIKNEDVDVDRDGSGDGRRGGNGGYWGAMKCLETCEREVGKRVGRGRAVECLGVAYRGAVVVGGSDENERGGRGGGGVCRFWYGERGDHEFLPVHLLRDAGVGVDRWQVLYM